jgi:Glycosyltransferase family 29 (sialyltransferase)
MKLIKCAIIGHGPSLEGAGLGQEIDQCDHIIRLKKGWELTYLNPKDYGRKTSILMSSTETLGTLITNDSFTEEVSVFVGYPKYGWYDEEQAMKIGRQVQKPLWIPLNLFNYWNFRFRNLMPKHPNISLGCAAIIFAANDLDCDSIELFGFDSLQNPDRKYQRIKTIPRTGRGAFPDHDWEKENILVGLIQSDYDVAIHAHGKQEQPRLASIQ